MTALSRRRVLGGALALVGGIAAGGSVLGGCAPAPVTRSVPGARPLAIPPLAPARTDSAGRRVFDLFAAPGRSTFLPGVTTATWGYGGLAFGGPTLRARRGEDVVVRVTNALDETTTTHWHGMSLPARADGGPHQPIAPGATWEAAWRIDQPAATLWYHPHPHGTTERHVHRGLSGLFLVDDDVEAELPARYGVDDLPVIVTDRSFAADGAFDTTRRNAAGLLGDTVLVNGTLAPYLDVSTERIRLRLLNASPARSYRFALDDGSALTLVGTDGGLLPAPRVVPDVVLTPAERAEVVIALVPGRRRTLRSLPHTLGGLTATARGTGALDTIDVLELRPAPRLEPSPAVPARLGREAPLDEAAATATRRFTLTNNEIDGRTMDLSRVDLVLAPGATEVWEFRNAHSMPHNMHVHDARMQILEPAVPPAGRAWKDTVVVPPASTVRVLVRVGPHTDPEAPYMYHCHLLRHEDDGMMGQFLVAGTGERAASTIGSPAAGGHGHG